MSTFLQRAEKVVRTAQATASTVGKLRVHTVALDTQMLAALLFLRLLWGPAHERMWAIFKAVLPTPINPIKKSPTGMPTG